MRYQPKLSAEKSKSNMTTEDAEQLLFIVKLQNEIEELKKERDDALAIARQCKFDFDIIALGRRHEQDRADAAEAKCAEMRTYLIRAGGPIDDQHANELRRDYIHCLSTDCGEGWRSPEQFAKELEPTIELLQHVRNYIGANPTECGHPFLEMIKAELTRLEKLVEEATK